MTAVILDGKATATQVKADLRVRVDALRALGITPGLGTVLVGDDPGSHAYVGGKHKDCAEVGMASIRIDLPADTSQEQLDAEIRRLNADPAVTGYIVQLPLPKHLDANRVLTLMDPAKDADGLHPRTLVDLCSGSRRRCPALLAASSSCCVAMAWRSTALRSSSSVAESRWVDRWACC